MKYYPVLLDLKNRKCCVVGGGRVAERKVKTLLKANSLVSVISPVLNGSLKKLARAKDIVHKKTVYKRSLIKGSFLVIAATDQRAVNEQVSRDSQDLGILTNIVDVPSLSNFIVPSVIEKNGLIISISTSGQAPCLSKKIRKDLTEKFVPRYAGLLKPLSRVRCSLKSGSLDEKKRKAALNKFINSGLGEKAGKLII
jgi:precorrin-2 dehydrogenase / sirohydrochlorin ferrochelatase